MWSGEIKKHLWIFISLFAFFADITQQKKATNTHQHFQLANIAVSIIHTIHNQMLISFLHLVTTTSRHHPFNPFLGNRSWPNAAIRLLNRFVPESINLNPQRFHSFYFASKFSRQALLSPENMMGAVFATDFIDRAQSKKSGRAGYWSIVSLMQ